MGEAYGSGLPLGWLFMCPKVRDPPQGSKQDVLAEWFSYFQDEWGINPLCTLLDKDQSEINAYCLVWSKADYQLCFWHVLCSVKKQLSI